MPCLPVSWKCIDLFLIIKKTLKKSQQIRHHQAGHGWHIGTDWKSTSKSGTLYDNEHRAVCYNLQPEPNQSVGSLNKYGVIPNGI